jgi:hypothetical protein
MAKFAMDLLRDEDRLREMGKAGQNVAHSKFCAEEVITQYENFYRKVLDRSS